MTRLEAKKLQTLATDEGHPGAFELIEANHIDSVVPAICMTEGCDYSTGMEPDQDRGWCEECNAGTVKSCLIIAGII